MRNDEETYNEFKVDIGFRVKCVYKYAYNHNVIIGDIVNVNNNSLYITGYDENRELLSVVIEKKNIVNIRRTRLKIETGTILDTYISEVVGKRELLVTDFVRMVTSRLKLYPNEKLTVGDLFFTIEILTTVGLDRDKFNFTDDIATNMQQIKNEIKNAGTIIRVPTLRKLEKYFKVITIYDFEDQKDANVESTEKVDLKLILYFEADKENVNYTEGSLPEVIKLINHFLVPVRIVRYPK